MSAASQNPNLLSRLSSVACRVITTQVSKEEQALLEADWGRECVEHAEEVGIDLGLLTENLRLTPRERMQQHDTSVRQILAVRKRLGIEENDDA